MANIEPIRDLLRTNSISRYLTYQARNGYVAAFRDLLYDLGFSRELGGDNNRNNNIYSDDLVNAIGSFAQRNRLNVNGRFVSPFLGATMVERHESLAQLKLLENAVVSGRYTQIFDLVAQNGQNSQALKELLEMTGVTGLTPQETLRNYAQRRNIRNVDGSQLTETVALQLLNDVYTLYGDGLQKINPNIRPNPGQPNPNFPPNQPSNPVNNPGNNNNNNPGNNSGNNSNFSGNRPNAGQPLNINDLGTTIVITDGVKQIQFRKHVPVGVSTPGFNSTINFVEQNKNRLMDLDLTPSALQVIEAISKNEGRLDAINSYDAGFLSIGIYQWTLGRAERAGELPAILKKLKTQFPATFNRHFPALGLDLSNETNTTYGHLILNGAPVNSGPAKDQFRDPVWGYYFWRALQEPDFQTVQVEHALDRLKNFYWKNYPQIFGNSLSQIITSAFGVALLLDNHVNRPSWVANCVGLAMQQTGMTNPSLMGDQDERNLIQAYLNVRETYTDGSGTAAMTKSRIRANSIYEEARAGRLSEVRGSFQFSNRAVAMFSGRNEKTVATPVDYDVRMFPDMENERQ
jgi:hypothetical protein